MIKTMEEFNVFLVEHELDNEKVKVSPVVQMEAMSKGWDVIKHIKNPTPAVQLTAVSANRFAVYFIEKPTSAVRKLFNQGYVNVTYAV